MRILILAATTLLVAGASVAAGEPAGSQRSTGNTETRVAAPTPAPAPAATPAPVQPQEPVRVALAGSETRKLVEGKASAASPAVVLWAAPTGRMLNVQLMTQGNKAALVVYQPGDEQPSPGTSPQDGAIRWIGENSKSGELRFEVHTKATAEIAFKLGLEIAGEGDAKP
jgi:hypothetical protein